MNDEEAALSSRRRQLVNDAIQVHQRWHGFRVACRGY
jgi:hypothetical protein